MEEKVKFELIGQELIRKEVKRYGSGTSATLYLPGDWAGQMVAVIRLGPASDEEDIELLPWGQWVKDLPDEGMRVWRCPYCLEEVHCEAFPDGPFESDDHVLCECDRYFKIGTGARWKQQIALEEDGDE